MNVTKVDPDVAHVAYFCMCFQCDVASVLKKMFLGDSKKNIFRRMLQQVFYLDVAYVSHICCKCFIRMLHMFHTHAASVLSRCCI